MRIITEHELRTQSGEILRQAEAGQQFTITVNDRPIAVLGPCGKQQWTATAEILEILRSQPPDPSFFDDLGEMGGTLDILGDPRG